MSSLPVCLSVGKCGDTHLGPQKRAHAKWRQFTQFIIHKVHAEQVLSNHPWPTCALNKGASRYDEQTGVLAKLSKQKK